jgi:ABC-type nickel/cobalt efflux system permease component RcnA
MRYVTGMLALASFLVVGCGGKAQPPAPSGGGKPAGGAKHAHKAMHGGALIELGDHEAHLELRVDTATGDATAWVMDAEVEKGLKIAQPEIRIKVQTKDGEQVLVLQADNDPTTGDRTGSAFTFKGKAEFLKDLQRFKGTVESVTIGKKAFEAVAFAYPEGNEGQAAKDAHDHDHDHKHDDGHGHGHEHEHGEAKDSAKDPPKQPADHKHE